MIVSRFLSGEGDEADGRRGAGGGDQDVIGTLRRTIAIVAVEGLTIANVNEIEVGGLDGGGEVKGNRHEDDVEHEEDAREEPIGDHEANENIIYAIWNVGDEQTKEKTIKGRNNNNGNDQS